MSDSGSPRPGCLWRGHLKKGSRTKDRTVTLFSECADLIGGSKEGTQALLADYLAAQRLAAPGRPADTKIDLTACLDAASDAASDVTGVDDTWTAPWTSEDAGWAAFGAPTRGPSVNVRDIGEKFSSASFLPFPSLRLGVQKQLLQLVLTSRGPGLRQFRKRGGYKILRDKYGFKNLGKTRWKKVLTQAPEGSKGGNPGIVHPKGSRKLIKQGKRPAGGRPRQEVLNDIARHFEINSEAAPVRKRVQRCRVGSGTAVLREVLRRAQHSRIVAPVALPTHALSPTFGRSTEHGGARTDNPCPIMFNALPLPSSLVKCASPSSVFSAPRVFL